MTENAVFNRTMARRSAMCFVVILLLFLSCILRVAVIAASPYSEIQAKQSSYRISMGRARGTVFDCNMVPITNAQSKILAAFSPVPSGVVAAHRLLNGKALVNCLENLEKGLPFVGEVKEMYECNGVAYTTVFENLSSDTPASHIVGYTDSTGHGVSGLQAAYDSLLYFENQISAVYTKGGNGELIVGIEPYFENPSSPQSMGVVSTIDVNIQSIAETAAQGIDKGAVIVAEARNAKIRAMVSRPQFNPTDISASLESDASPLLNRALSAYSVGSVFKPCVAAAALEMGRGEYEYNCVGNTYIIDRSFNCHKRDGHGTLDLSGALAFSCNTFFYNFAISIGAAPIYKMASSLNFGNSIRIADNISTGAGSMPSLSSLDNEAAVANMSIGQGSISASPVSMLPLYCAIATDGSYFLPSVVEGTLKNGAFKKYDIGLATKVMSEDTALKIRKALVGVVTEGTGTAAKSDTVTTAGKTATAQTGRRDENGAEITNSWFCGFFPADAPKYVVIVMSEGNSSASTPSVFADIADGIYSLNNND